MIYPISLYGDPILRMRASEIKKDCLDIIKLSNDMFETMNSAEGIGIAAPQIGLSLRIFVVDTSSLKEEGLGDFKKVFVNPEIISESGESWGFEEGCLSIPNIRESVSRKKNVIISYFDQNWNFFTETFDGMKARIIQHEHDHIEGKLFTDYVSPLKKKLIKGKLLSISKGICDVPYNVKRPK